MNALKRAVIATVAATGVASAATPDSRQLQQQFPTQPIRLVVGYAPGGGPDTSARMVAPVLNAGGPVFTAVRPRRGRFAGVVFGGEGGVMYAAPDGRMANTAMRLMTAVQRARANGGHDDEIPALVARLRASIDEAARAKS